jgi:hypothetical protein
MGKVHTQRWEGKIVRHVEPTLTGTVLRGRTKREYGWVVILIAAGDQEPLGKGGPLRKSVLAHYEEEKNTGSVTGEAQGEKTVEVVTLAAVGDQEPLERGWTSPEECFSPSKGACSGSEV